MAHGPVFPASVSDWCMWITFQRETMLWASPLFTLLGFFHTCPPEQQSGLSAGLIQWPDRKSAYNNGLRFHFQKTRNACLTLPTRNRATKTMSYAEWYVISWKQISSYERCCDTRASSSCHSRPWTEKCSGYEAPSGAKPTLKMSSASLESFHAATVEVEVTLRLTVSQLYRVPLWDLDQIVFPIGMLLSEICGLVSIGRPLRGENGSAT
jgi:hypothetical protein